MDCRGSISRPWCWRCGLCITLRPWASKTLWSDLGLKAKFSQAPEVQREQTSEIQQGPEGRTLISYLRLLSSQQPPRDTCSQGPPTSHQGENPGYRVAAGEGEAWGHSGRGWGAWGHGGRGLPLDPCGQCSSGDSSARRTQSTVDRRQSPAHEATTHGRPPHPLPRLARAEALGAQAGSENVGARQASAP